MINIDGFESELKKGDIGSGYVFCGLDEELIKENINILVKKLVPDEFMTLNYERLDGLTTTFNDIENACETMPFFGEKKVIVVYRANFLKDKTDKEGAKLYSEISEYVKNLPPYAVLIMYYLFNDKRDTPKKNKKLSTLDKYVRVVHCDKLKKDKYYKKIEDIFKENGRTIGKVQLKYFVDKLDCYALGRELTKEDIDKLIPNKSEDDIFDLVEYISLRKVEKAIDLLDELLFKADQHMLIISSIGNHLKRLYEIKIYLLKGKKLEFFISKYRLPQFVCEKLMNQASKFSLKQLNQLIKVCVNTEIKLKSSTTDKQMEMELMLFKTFMIK